MSTISKLRESMGLNQYEFAKALGVSQAAVSQMELGKIKPRVQVALRLVELAKQQGQFITLEDVYFVAEPNAAQLDQDALTNA